MNKPHLFLLLLLVGVTSCLREPLKPKVVDTIYLHQDLLDYFCSTSLGSWYVFEEEGSGLHDTVRVTRYSNDRNEGRRVGNIDEYHYIESQRFFVEYTPQNSSMIKFDMSAYGTDSGRVKISNAGDVMYNGLYCKGKWRNIYQFATDSFIMLDSLSVGGKLYHNVLKIYSPTNSSLYRDLYFAKGVGLIRKGYGSGKVTYNLISWERK